MPLLHRDGLEEIIFVDDGSTDDTPAIVSEYPVRYIRGDGRGPGSARNIGWRAAEGALVWFVDSDCVAEPDALERLLPHVEDPEVGGVGGSYGNMEEASLLACLIHEEIVQRHLAMPQRVDFLATFNVLYRRSVLEQIQGFDERLLKGQDAELSWRVLDAGYQLDFEVRSRVKHFHPVSWRSYLRTQYQQGYWRVWLYRGHRRRAAGDSYSGFVDHVQPPLAMLTLVLLPLMGFAAWRWVPLLPLALLSAAQIPMTCSLVRRAGRLRYLCFALMSFMRAFWRGFGASLGVLASLRAARSIERASGRMDQTTAR